MYCNWQCNYLPLVYHLPIAMNVKIVDLNVYLIMYRLVAAKKHPSFPAYFFRVVNRHVSLPAIFFTGTARPWLYP